MEATAYRRATLARLADFWALTKGKQTALLSITGFCAYTLSQGPPLDLVEATWMIATLLLSISGCTALNMFLDRDIDARMRRTANRPLPAGRMRPFEARVFGVLLSAVGLALAFGLGLRFGSIAALGFIFDLLVYTVWLKRRTPFSVVLGGVSGGMPVLAGRVLALGHVDLVGLLMASSILLWTPSHNLTLAIRYADDYDRAGVPVWPNVYGVRAARQFIAGANFLNALAFVSCAFLLRVHPVAQVVLLGTSLGVFVLSVRQLLAPTEQRDRLLFKIASFYMMASLLLLVGGAFMK
jgi:protoheme IX farnesyltransferase